jgi:hypothetical protein
MSAGPIPQNEEAARKEHEKERAPKRSQQSIQWAYDTFEGAMSVGRQSTPVAIEFIHDAWDQSSTSTILYFVIAVLGLSNLWTLIEGDGGEGEVGGVAVPQLPFASKSCVLPFLFLLIAL